MEFHLKTEFITLGQLLKALGMASTGGDAKYLLESGEVIVNGEPESRRGRKLRPNDTVAFPNGDSFVMK